MSPSLRGKLRAMGPDLTPDMLMGTTVLFAGMMKDVVSAPVEITRDVKYGSHERHRLDIFQPEKLPQSPPPVLLFVHGGGFVMGAKSAPGSPFYDNVGRWAAARGWIGVTMNYRLAPMNQWPCGAEDVGSAVQWIVNNIAQYGGDPRNVFALGQSAGAVHVATYIALPHLHDSSGSLAGALLLSGLYDVPSVTPNDFQRAYYGTDSQLYAERSCMSGIAQTQLPLLLAISEFDPPDFHRQAALFVAASYKAKQRYPHMVYLADHNHLSPVLALGLPDDTVGAEIQRFIHAVCVDRGVGLGAR